MKILFRLLLALAFCVRSAVGWVSGWKPLLLLALAFCVRSADAQEMRVPTLNEAPRFFASPSGPSAAAATVTSASTLTVDTSHREESRIIYNAVYSASENVAIGWTGDTASGNAGTTTQTFRD